MASSVPTNSQDFHCGNHPTQTTLTPCNSTVFDGSIGSHCVDMTGKSTATMNNKVGTPSSPTATNVPKTCTSQDTKNWVISIMDDDWKNKVITIFNIDLKHGGLKCGIVQVSSVA